MISIYTASLYHNTFGQYCTCCVKFQESSEIITTHKRVYLNFEQIAKSISTYKK